MSRIRGRGTTPELVLRRAISSTGLRGYRLHHRLPGKPDIVFPARRIAIFIDGCFWHRCPKCFTAPATRRAFWTRKIASNMKRDRRVGARLRRDGWTVLRIWEHETRDLGAIEARVISKIRDTGGNHQGS